MLGRALAGRPRDSYVVATKVYGEMPDGDRGLSREQVLKQIDDSLGRLALDHVDLYQCHSWDDDVPVEETLGALTEVVDAGKARFIGVSNWSGEQIRGAVELAREHGFAKIVSSQPEYSLLHREPEQDVIPASRENGVSQIVYSPLAQGVLSGKYRAGRGRWPTGRAPPHAATAPVVSTWPTTCSSGCSGSGRSRTGSASRLAQLALAWILREPNVASAIVGASRPEQLRDNAAASGVVLDDGDDAGRSTPCSREPQARSCSCRARRSTTCAPRSSRPARGGSATTSAAPGTREGTGTFLGGEGTSPSVGRAGREERVAELRLETVFPGRAAGRGRRRAARARTRTRSRPSTSTSSSS